MAPNILIMLLTCNAGDMGPGATPPMALVPHGEVVLVAVAEGGVAATPAAQAGAMIGVALMAGGPGQPDKEHAPVETENTTKKEWTEHGFKHFPPKNKQWKEIISTTKTGPAKYKPNLNIEKIERLAWEKGKICTNGKPWKVMEFDTIIGANGGIETNYIRVECSANMIHGHPITKAEYLRLIR